jgi:hypothetical protein
MSDTAKVHEFLKGNRNVTAREISGGSGVPIESVVVILGAVLSAGEIVETGGSANTTTYSLTGSTLPVVEPSPASYVSEEARWNAGAQARERALAEARKPKPEPSYQPTEAELQAALDAKKTTHVLTEDERRELKLGEGHRGGVNPQLFIRR